MNYYFFCYFFNILHKYSWATKKMCNQNFVHQFHPTKLLPEVWKNLFIILKLRSHAKYLHFSELNMKTRKSLRVVSLSASSLVVYCLQCNLNVLYLHDSTQCYKQRTTLVQPQFVVRSCRILNFLLSAETSPKYGRARIRVYLSRLANKPSMGVARSGLWAPDGG